MIEMIYKLGIIKLILDHFLVVIMEKQLMFFYHSDQNSSLENNLHTMYSFMVSKLHLLNLKIMQDHHFNSKLYLLQSMYQEL